MNSVILGALIDSKSDSSDKLNVLYLPCNDSHFRMSCIIARETNFNNFIFFEGLNSESKLESFKENNFNAKIFKDVKTLASFFKSIDRVVVFVGSVQIFLPKSYNKILSAALELGKPVIEMPHGLFQSGYNLTDNAVVLDSASYYDGFGGSFPSVTTKKLWWYGEGAVGYPRTLARESYPDLVVPDFTLITSNTNWYLYSQADKRNFFKAVFEYAEKHPSVMFLWSPHPAEMNEGTYSSGMIDIKPSNVYIYGEDREIYFHSIENTDDLIKYCKSGISTVSTCLLDYEMHNKPVTVFSCPGVSALIESMTCASTFENCDDIEEITSIIQTGYLFDFDTASFEMALLDDEMKVDPEDHKYIKLFT